MKRILSFLLILALLASLLSCQNDARAEIENELESARAENEAKVSDAGNPETDGLPAHTGENTDPTPEAAEPALAPPKTDWDHIRSSSYDVFDNKFYYNLKAKKTIPFQGGHKTGALVVHAYTDLVTLASGYLCPDPLCSHDDLIQCPYTAWSSSAPFCIVGKNTVYMTRSDWSDPSRAVFRVYKADLTNNAVRAVYSPMGGGMPVPGEADKGILYIFDSVQYTDPNSRTTEWTDYMIGLSVETDEVLFTREMPDDCHIHMIRNGKILYSTTKELIRCDPDFKNPEVLFAFKGTGGVADWYYDEYRDEFWFLIVKRGYQSGSVWRILGNGTAEEVLPPAKQVIYFQLTNSKIYFSVYDPLKLGEHPTDPGGTVDTSGGKIYAVDRDDPLAEPLLVYDTHGETFLCIPGVNVYAVFGDQLFFQPALLTDYREPDSEKIYKVLSIAGDLPMHRVDLTTGEEEIIRLD